LMAQVRPAHIYDGADRTFLVGEKFVNPKKYKKGDDTSDNNTMFQGNDADITRWCGSGLHVMHDYNSPVSDLNSLRFGSPHSAGTFFVFCDGHVQLIDYGIDAVIYANLANRKDGAVFGDLWSGQDVGPTRTYE